MSANSLVVFYSWSGNTHHVARLIAEQAGADLHEIKPITAYPVDYHQVAVQAKKELNLKFRPQLIPFNMNWDQYEVVYLGTPNWCGTMAPPLASFLWEWMPTDKMIVPFCTHGGGGAGRIAHDIADYCIGCNMLPLLSIYRDGGSGAEKEVGLWLKRITKILELSNETSFNR